ncbi:hypothetical protein TNCT_24291 [Trichonephila clavata]|uniref:Uncharacterized protein n=1 Tax=Trichonephila clavata TaxID=2740835 RepID=A0A8X6I2C8_TRICU|nr:hypothetical protein TNCT_24291 [Trichonephila clavata]
MEQQIESLNSEMEQQIESLNSEVVQQIESLNSEVVQQSPNTEVDQQSSELEVVPPNTEELQGSPNDEMPSSWTIRVLKFIQQLSILVINPSVHIASLLMKPFLRSKCKV